MPRPKTLPDEDVLDAALALMHADGPDTLTFASLASACGLSAAALVQRFGSKAGLKRSALLHAWDQLDEKTARLAASTAPTPQGAIDLLVGLSEDYGGIERYAEGLILLREDLRDSALRARGAAWNAALVEALERCFHEWPRSRGSIGVLMASQWQGSLLWWSFDPRTSLTSYVRQRLEEFVDAIAGRNPPPHSDPIAAPP